MTTDIDNHVQFSSTTMTDMSGDYAAGRHTRSQGPPPMYTETDSNTSLPVHQDLQNNGRFLSLLPLAYPALTLKKSHRY